MRRGALEVQDVMTTEVTTCGPATPFKDVVRLLLDHYVSGVPVVDDGGHVLGIVTEADLVAHDAYGDEPRRLLSVLTDRLVGRVPWVEKAAALQAKELMTTDVVTVGPEDDIAFAARLMLERGVRRLPVVDADRLVGIVARSDLLRWFCRGDDALRQAVEELLARPGALPPAADVEVTVQDGVVALEGHVPNDRDRSNAVELAHLIPGVVAVDEHLVASDPEALLEDLRAPLG